MAEELRALSADITRNAAAGTMPPLHVGEWCRHCPSLTACPAQVSLVRALAGEPDELVRSFAEALTPERAAAAYGKLKAIRSLVERLEAAMESYAAQQPIDLGDGRVFGAQETKRDSLDGNIVWRVLEAKYGAASAWEAVELKATKAGIDRVVRKVIAERGGKVSHLNREVLSEVAGLGGVRVNWTNSVREHVVKEPNR